ncbi:MAG: hypothetical protein V4574_08965 [Pseudomonadota bacterium]
MRRLVLGSFVGGLAMWVVGFIFWGPLLGWLPFTVTSDASAAAVQAALKANLAATGSGTYAIPSTATTAGSVLHANGPVAMVHFTNSGFPGMDTFALLWGLVLAICCAFVGGLALRSVAADLGFGQRVQLVALFAVAMAGYTQLGQPVFNHAAWGYYLYAFVADIVTWLAAGSVLALFLPLPDEE